MLGTAFRNNQNKVTKKRHFEKKISNNKTIICEPGASECPGSSVSTRPRVWSTRDASHSRNWTELTIKAKWAYQQVFIFLLQLVDCRLLALGKKKMRVIISSPSWSSIESRAPLCLFVRCWPWLPQWKDAIALWSLLPTVTYPWMVWRLLSGHSCLLHKADTSSLKGLLRKIEFWILQTLETWRRKPGRYSSGQE